MTPKTVLFSGDPQNIHKNLHTRPQYFDFFSENPQNIENS